ncbi:MAG: sulfite exporter TauE/SafE family protein [Acidimicrobiales bacterium]
MNLWSIFVTGLFAGGASCAAVQGGLLVASVVRRDATSAKGLARQQPARRRPPTGKNARKNRQRHQRAAAYQRAEAARRAAPGRINPLEDAVPVAGFLAGKLASHVLLGALLGLFGSAVQISYQVRSLMQIGAGVFMVLIAANLPGVPGLGWIVPSPPARPARLVRRSARSEAAFAPGLLGFPTVLIPCGVTLSVMFLAIASGSVLWGAAAMAIFVIGTSPLFAAIGYTVRRSAARLRRSVTMLSAGAVLLAGLVAINTGLVLRGSSFTLGQLVRPILGGQPAEAVAAPIDETGTQQLLIEAHSRSYSPSRVAAQAGVPSVLTLQTNGTRGCTRAFVLPALGLQRVLPESGDTTIDLGVLEPGDLRFTCSMGMYSGVIEVT